MLILMEIFFFIIKIMDGKWLRTMKSKNFSKTEVTHTGLTHHLSQRRRPPRPRITNPLALASSSDPQHTPAMYQPILFTNVTITQEGDIWLHAMMESVDPDHPDQAPEFCPRPAKAFINRKRFPRDFDPRLHGQMKVFDVINERLLHNDVEWVAIDNERRVTRSILGNL